MKELLTLLALVAVCVAGLVSPTTEPPTVDRVSMLDTRRQVRLKLGEPLETKQGRYSRADTYANGVAAYFEASGEALMFVTGRELLIDGELIRVGDPAFKVNDWRIARRRKWKHRRFTSESGAYAEVSLGRIVELGLDRRYWAETI